MSSGSSCSLSRTDGWRVQGSDEWQQESLLGVTKAATSSDERMVIIAVIPLLHGTAKVADTARKDARVRLGALAAHGPFPSRSFAQPFSVHAFTKLSPKCSPKRVNLLSL